MANFGPAVWYCNYGNGSSTGHFANTAWATGAVKAAGALVRQLAAPTVGNERIFVCIVAGTTHATTEPTWTVTKGAKTTDNTVTWQECTGQPGVCGDTTNSPTWTQNKNTVLTLGLIIYDAGTSSLQIVSTAGTTGNGSAPGFSATAGVTTADNTVTWTSLGAASNFAAWKAPFARVQSIYGTGWAAAGDTAYLASAHAETQTANMTITFTGTSAAMNRLICVNAAGSIPPVSADLTTGASITTTTSGNLTLNGSAYMRGITFSGGSGASSGFMSMGAAIQTFDSCAIAVPASAAVNSPRFNASGRYLLTNTTFQYGVTGSTCLPTGWVRWTNTASALTGGTIPSTLFANGAGVLVLDGVDLSAAGSGKTLFAASNIFGACVMMNCKLGASVTIAAAPTSAAAAPVDLLISDSGAQQYRQERYAYAGTLTAETTIVPSNQQASDGTTPITWKIVTTANSAWTNPFETFAYAEWNNTTGGALTRTFEIVNDGTTLTNADIWAQVEYLGSSATPVSSLATSGTADILAAGVNITTSTATWTTTGLGSPIKQKIAITVTPQMKGLMRITFKVAKASKTIYVNPRPNEQ